MKRLRGDDDGDAVEVGSRSKKASSGSGSSSLAGLEETLAYIKTVRERLSQGRKSDSYGEFLVVMQDFKARRMDFASVLRRIKKLFEGCRDLISGFNVFLPERYKISPDDEDDGGEIRTRLFNEGIRLCNKVEQVLCNSGYLHFLQLLHHYNCGDLSGEELKAAVTHILGSDPNLAEEFIDFFKAPEEQLRKIEEEEEKKEEEQMKPVEEFNGFIKAPEEQLRKIEEEEKEEEQMKSAEEEDYSFKQKRTQQQYEEIMVKCEDDRFEMEMLMGVIITATEKVKKLLNGIEEKKINLESGIKIEDHLSFTNRMCIEKLYGDHGLEVMDALREKPMEALPVIFKRLEQKQDEFKMHKEDLNKFCINPPNPNQKKPEGKLTQVEQPAENVLLQLEN